MKLKKLMAILATGALSVSCLVLATGCSGAGDSTESDLKEAFIHYPDFAEPESNVFTNNEPFELVDFSYEESFTDPEGKMISADIVATVKNNVSTLKVEATATDTNPNGDDAEYEIEIKDAEVVEVNGINAVPDGLTRYDPDFDGASVRNEEGDWYCDLTFSKVPTFLTGEMVFTGEFFVSPGSANYFEAMWRVRDDENPSSYEVDYDAICGTYASEDNDITFSIAKSSGTDADGNDYLTVTFDNPAPIEIGSFTFPVGVAKIDKVSKYKAELQEQSDDQGQVVDGRPVLRIEDSSETNVIENSMAGKLDVGRQWMPYFTLTMLDDGKAEAYFDEHVAVYAYLIEEGTLYTKQ